MRGEEEEEEEAGNGEGGKVEEGRRREDHNLGQIPGILLSFQFGRLKESR